MYPATTPYETASGVGVAPVAGLFPVAGEAREWSSRLLDCFDDFDICCMTFWCPCITFGRTAEIVDHGMTSCGTSAALFALIQWLSGSQCTWAFSCTYRTRLRAQHGLPEAPCADFLVHLCCLHCALCQEYRELKARGYEPVLGWEFNAQRAAAGVAMCPPASQGMGR
ncbi:cell number regulator 3 [Zea mays]|uniref:Cell number regulator 3 n=2 Tax=Zea mays TaxID=4577 RepID=CNR3_MAIZE|nr:cell number regulator 3 [Zea mays]D9HP19.1 RecName: Full=Cell number regulator 3; AltName: Full=ZmCNR03 [Zea mays]ADI48417.1 cell number regulator 3 [Zea mays]AQK61787.1 Cell number regulator 3 [Zea mays]|eukprot:NP_001182140.1 cell number regulator 3 [Zea mays]